MKEAHVIWSHRAGNAQELRKRISHAIQHVTDLPNEGRDKSLVLHNQQQMFVKVVETINDDDSITYTLLIQEAV